MAEDHPDLGQDLDIGQDHHWVAGFLPGVIDLQHLLKVQEVQGQVQALQALEDHMKGQGQPQVGQGHYQARIATPVTTVQGRQEGGIGHLQGKAITMPGDLSLIGHL